MPRRIHFTPEAEEDVREAFRFLSERTRVAILAVFHAHRDPGTWLRRG
jgi:plasmid stabilization system protein ParE